MQLQWYFKPPSHVQHIILNCLRQYLLNWIENHGRKSTTSSSHKKLAFTSESFFIEIVSTFCLHSHLLADQYQIFWYLQVKWMTTPLSTPDGTGRLLPTCTTFTRFFLVSQQHEIALLASYIISHTRKYFT